MHIDLELLHKSDKLWRIDIQGIAKNNTILENNTIGETLILSFEKPEGKACFSRVLLTAASKKTGSIPIHRDRAGLFFNAHLKSHTCPSVRRVPYLTAPLLDQIRLHRGDNFSTNAKSIKMRYTGGPALRDVPRRNVRACCLFVIHKRCYLLSDVVVHFECHNSPFLPSRSRLSREDGTSWP